LVLGGAALSGAIVSVLAYIVLGLTITCDSRVNSCEPWGIIAAAILAGIFATLIGGALTYWCIRNPAAKTAAGDA
jgi:hypothetical protein